MCHHKNHSQRLQHSRLLHKQRYEPGRRKKQRLLEKKEFLQEYLGMAFYSLSLSLNFDPKIENKLLKHSIHNNKYDYSIY
jgi:hypothetical protein